MAAFRSRRYQNIPLYLKVSSIALPTGLAVYLYGKREAAPYTGRKRLILMSREQERKMGEVAFHQVLQGQKVLAATHPMTKAVQRVGRKLAAVSGESKETKWQFVVVDSPEINAFVLPGGKVCVYSGLFQVLKNEDSLAAVIGHEVGHAIARHVAEKVTLSTFFIALMLLIDPNSANITRWFYSLFVDLPFSRHFETEADYIGLQLMAKACFDPAESPAVFERMEQKIKGGNLKYLSTHPPSHERVSTLRGHLAEAKSIYEASGCAYKRNKWNT